MKMNWCTGKWRWLILVVGIIIGSFLVLGVNRVVIITSTNEYCQSCHIHTGADQDWLKSPHYLTESGTITGCVDCHLPPPGDLKHFVTKVRTGLHDLFAYHFKDSASFDWESKQQLEYAVSIVYNESCSECHQNLFPKGITEEGGTAHLYYEQNVDKLDLNCINCHLDAGHYLPHYQHERMTGFAISKEESQVIFTEPTPLTSFASYTERIPNTAVSFHMIAIEGGEFSMGSPGDEPFRDSDEGPVRTVKISPFFLGETEVTWDEYWTFFGFTMSEGRTDPKLTMAHNAGEPDAISGPTPPFGNPDQGWGGGDRPAITMTHYAARTYCQWLSKVTGKKYRLPTEAEWEYACRAGTETPYFFEGDPKRFSVEGFWNKIFGADTTTINSFVVYALNSGGKTQGPSYVRANSFGLKNMSGNVLEYCSDWYSPEAYSLTQADILNPAGPVSGTEHVIRGGYYASQAGDLRSASRASTESISWLKTDCQQPKSIWWYSDMKGIGFRLVCEPDSQMIMESRTGNSWK